MRDKINTITDEITKLLDLQSELSQKMIFPDLAPKEMDEYHARRDRIHQLCSELSSLSA
jgi:uncharacterized coiled-coil DUF342 family protein